MAAVAEQGLKIVTDYTCQDCSGLRLMWLGVCPVRF